MGLLKARCVSFTTAAVTMLGILAVAPPAHAATFTVTTAADGTAPVPAGSLREAINSANASDGPHLIKFDIPGDGPHVIDLTTALPSIIKQTTIDGYTQGEGTATLTDDAVENSLPVGTNAVIKIEINGANISGNPVLLIVGPSGTVIRGLAINNSPNGHGIRMQSASGNFRVEGCFIGTDAGGTVDLGNGDAGISIGNGSGNEGTIVGGDAPAHRNIIAGNAGHGIGIATTDITVMNNLIGINKTESFLENGADGVSIVDGTGHTVMNNSIVANGSADDLAIDLNNDGSTPNDKKDRDTGENNLQNFPKLASAIQDTDGFTILRGKLKSTPKKVFTLQFFSNPIGVENDAVDHLGDLTVKTNRDGIARFKFIPQQNVGTGDSITATATRLTTGDTSEVSAPVTVAA